MKWNPAPCRDPQARAFSEWLASVVNGPFEVKSMTLEEEKQISKDGEIWWLPPKN